MIRSHSIPLIFLTLIYGAILAVVAGVNHFGADNWWLGAFNLYLPQVFWAVPALLLGLALLGKGRWVWLPVLYLAWVLGPIMGLRWSPQDPPELGSVRIRVMTCNAKFGMRDPAELQREIRRYQPQLVLLQDSPGLSAGWAEALFKGWQIRTSGQFVLASKFPLGPAEILKVAIPHGHEAFLRCQVKLGGTAVTVFNVHFQSPRESLNAFRSDRSGLDAAAELEQNAAVRLEQAQVVAELVRSEPGPVIVAGDFNSPETSRVCATLREAGLADAFSAGGRGYGYTYGHFLLQHRLPWLHLSWMRIDHIMVDSRTGVWRCWSGTDKASDHRPVFADLWLSKS